MISKLVQKPLLRRVMSVLNMFFIGNELAHMRSLIFPSRSCDKASTNGASLTGCSVNVGNMAKQIVVGIHDRSNVSGATLQHRQALLTYRMAYITR